MIRGEGAEESVEKISNDRMVYFWEMEWIQVGAKRSDFKERKANMDLSCLKCVLGETRARTKMKSLNSWKKRSRNKHRKRKKEGLERNDHRSRKRTRKV